MCVKGTVPTFVKLQVITFIVVAAGCTPLQQAPLVYTSSQVIGVKLAVAPTQPESIEAIIGYRDIDAAYAPVAVSNPRPANAAQTSNSYDKDLYEIKEIYGIYGTQASATNASQLLTQQESADMQIYLQRSQAKYLSNIETNNSKGIFERAQDLKKWAGQLQSALGEEGCLKSGGSGSLEDDYKRLLECPSSASRSLVASTRPLISFTNETYRSVAEHEKAAKEKYEELEGKYQSELKGFNEMEGKVKGALDKLASIQKRDAISVYGSFDGDTGAEAAGLQPGDSSKSKNGVKVKVGKVFATGVAAQNISEAQKISASAVVVSACIDIISEQAIKLYPPGVNDSGRTGYMKDLMPECFVIKKDKQGKNIHE